MSREDEEILKTLVSDTRRKIIKTLSEGDRTPTDLSRLLKKSKSTIVEHLEKLMKVGLVEKIKRPGHKWVFYSLTREGQTYISRKSQRLIIILSMVFLSLLGGVFSLIKYLSYQNYLIAKAGEGILEEMTSRKVNIDTVTHTTSSWLLYLSVALFTLALIGLFTLILMKKKRLIEV